MKPTFLRRYQTQFTTLPSLPPTDLKGKTIVVTGGNTGLGYEAVKHFAAMSPGKIIIACRSRERGETAIEKLKQDTGFERFELRLLDLANFSSVVAFTDELQQSEDRLDILLANAGLIHPEYRETSDGWEESLQVNSISTFLYTVLLVPLMLKTGEKTGTSPRIVIVGSGRHYYATLDEQLLKSGKFFETYRSREYCTNEAMKRRYQEAKLINLFAVRTLAEILKTTPIVVNSICPGLCASGLARDYQGKGIGTKAAIWLAFKVFARSSEEGGRQLAWAAIGPNEGDAMRGAFMTAMRITEPSDYVISKEGTVVQELVWKELVTELTKIDSRVPDVLNLTA